MQFDLQTHIKIKVNLHNSETWSEICISEQLQSPLRTSFVSYGSDVRAAVISNKEKFPLIFVTLVMIRSHLLSNFCRNSITQTCCHEACFGPTCTSPVPAAQLAPSGPWLPWWRSEKGRQLWQRWSSRCTVFLLWAWRLQQLHGFQGLVTFYEACETF